MNRLVLIGNGFDLAHGLKTSYADFINWYWERWGELLRCHAKWMEEDEFCSFSLNKSIGLGGWYLVWSHRYGLFNPTAQEIVEIAKNDTGLCEFKYKSPFFEQINKSIENKGWVDIENEYYLLLKRYAIENPSKNDVINLNKQLHFLQDKLIEYLSEINEQDKNTIDKIKEKIFAPINSSDVAVGATKVLNEYVDWCMGLQHGELERKLKEYGIDSDRSFIYLNEVDEYWQNRTSFVDYPRVFRLPDNIMLLNFNYTNTAMQYMPLEGQIFFLNHIHGEVSNPQNVIFGYGDELDDDYKAIQNINDNDYLKNVKSIRYLESCKYRSVLSFIDSAPFQVCIMGHSCGNSDRTLLNTLFEHRNCISIKPYYYIKDDGTDNYLELVQNISRNFIDMKLMRDRVVNKDYCEPLTGVKPGVIVMG